MISFHPNKVTHMTREKHMQGRDLLNLLNLPDDFLGTLPPLQDIQSFAQLGRINKKFNSLMKDNDSQEPYKRKYQEEYPISYRRLQYIVTDANQYVNYVKLYHQAQKKLFKNWAKREDIDISIYPCIQLNDLDSLKKLVHERVGISEEILNQSVNTQSAMLNTNSQMKGKLMLFFRNAKKQETLLWMSVFKRQSMLDYFYQWVQAAQLTLPDFPETGNLLSWAVQCNQTNTVATILGNQIERVPIETEIIDGARNGHVDVVRLLLSATNIPIPFFNQAIYAAVKSGHTDVLQMLLADERVINGSVNINEYDKIGMDTPIHTAIINDEIQCLEILSQHDKVEINKGDANDRYGGLLYAVKMNNMPAVKVLLNAPGIIISQNDGRHGTPLECAIYWGHVEIAELLLNHTNELFESAFLIATKLGYTELVRKILQKNPSIKINAEDTKGFSALTYATLNGDVRMIELLKSLPGISEQNNVLLPYQSFLNAHHQDRNLFVIRYGVDHNFVICRAEYLYDIYHFNGTLAARAQDSTNFTTELVQTFALDQALIMAIQRSRKTFIDQVLQKGDVSVDFRDETGKTALHHAAIQGNFNLIKKLNEGLPEYNFSYFSTQTESNEKNRSLIWDINVVDNDGNTPLILAAMHHPTLIPDVIISCKPDVTVRNIGGNTFFHYILAGQIQSNTVTQIFSVSRVSDYLNMVNNAGETPLIIALKRALRNNNDSHALQVLALVANNLYTDSGSASSVLLYVAQTGDMDLLNKFRISVPDHIKHYGNTCDKAFVIASKNGHQNVLEYLSQQYYFKSELIDEAYAATSSEPIKQYLKPHSILEVAPIIASVPQNESIFERFTHTYPKCWNLIKYIVIPASIAALLVFTGGLGFLGLAAGYSFLVTTTLLSLLGNGANTIRNPCCLQQPKINTIDTRVYESLGVSRETIQQPTNNSEINTDASVRPSHQEHCTETAVIQTATQFLAIPHGKRL